MKRFLFFNVNSIILSLFTIISYAQVPAVTSASTVTTTAIRVTFTNGPLTAVDFTKFNISGGVTVSAATISGATTVDLTVSAVAVDYTCPNCLSVQAGGLTNSNGSNVNSPTNPIGDGIKPTAVITYSDVDGIVKTGDIITITATFSEAIKDAPPAMQIALSGANILAATNMVKLSTTQYKFDHTVVAGNGAVTVTLSSGTDVNGALVASAPTSGGSFTVDNTAPAIALTDDHPDAIVRDADNIIITATFTDANAIDEGTVPKITIGSLVTNVSMTKTNNLIWTYTWNVPAGNDGNVAVSVTATDIAGNPNSAATAGAGGTTSYTIDNTSPTVELTDNHPDAIVRDADNVIITATFTEANVIAETSVPKISIGSIVTNANMIKSSNLVWTYTWNVPSGNDGNAAVTITSTDVAGNPNSNATAGIGGTTSYTIDNIAPTAPSVPASTAGPDINAAENGTFSIDISGLNTTGAVVGDVLEILVNGSSFAAPQTKVLTAGDIATGYTFTNITLPGPDGSKNITARVTDVAGNPGVVSPQLALNRDITPPTLLISAPSVSAANTGPVTYTITYTGASSVNLVNANITLNTTPTATGSFNVTNGTTNTPTVTISGITGDGTLGISIAAGTASDAAGNTSSGAGPSTTFIVDNTPPAPLGVAPDLTTLTDSKSPYTTGNPGTDTDNITNSANPTFVGSAVNGTTVKIYSGVTEIGSGAVSGSAYSISVGAIAEGPHTITARVIDAAGNLSTVSPSINITIDRSPPLITGSIWSDGGSGREVVTVSFNETLGIPNGTAVAQNDEDQPNRDGFYVTLSTSATNETFRDDATTYSSATNKISLTSGSNANWASSAIKFTYNNTADQPTNAGQNHPNYVYDLAGNEMATIANFTPSDAEAPKLVSGFVLNPNGNNPETIVFVLSEAITLANPTGFIVDGVPTAASFNGSNNVVTLTSPGDGSWNNGSVVRYTPGNVSDGTNAMVSFGDTPIRIQNISISSNNANLLNQRAKPGDVITVSFVTAVAPSITPIVKIDNSNALVAGAHPNWSATYTTSGTNNTGTLPLLVSMLTVSDSTGTNSTTLPLPVSSSVVFDKTPPTITPIAILSNNANPSFAKPGNNVTLSFTVNENLFNTPTVTIGGASAFVTNIGLNYTATVTLNNAFTEGVLPILINVQDEVGNLASATATTNASSVTFDKTPPSVFSITLNNSIINSYASSINGTTPALNGNQVDFLVTFTEPVNGVTTSSINRAISPVIGSLQFPAITTNLPAVTPVTSGGIATSAPSQYWKVVYPVVTGTGTLSINVLNDINIIDNVQLPITGGSAGPAYTVSLPQPSLPVTSFSSSTGASSITVNWTDVPGASHYLVIVTTSSPPSPAVTDGTYVVVDFIIGDGTVSQNIAQGVQSATFSGLAASGYNIFIYPYALSPNTTSVNTTAIDFNSITPATLSRNSDIIRDTGFSYTQNIDYKTFQATDIPTGSGTGSIVLERFLLRDGTDADNLGTNLSSITLDIVNYQNLRQLGLYNGTAEIQELSVSGANITVINPTTARMTFSSLAPFTAADGTSQPLSIRGSFLGNGVTDNQIISFIVVSVTASSTSSSQFITNSPTGIQSNLPSGTNNDNNKIEVTASKLDYTSIPLSATINVNFGPVVIQARDVNNNIDQDFVSAVSAFGNNDAVAMINTPFTPDPILSFAAGQLTFPVNFQFTATPGDGSTQLSISAGGINNQLSPAIGVVSSQESVLSYNSVAFIARLPYITFQSSDITGPGNSAALATFVLQDGNGVTLDIDGAPTKISSITFDITTTNNLGVTVAGAKDIRKIALYNAIGLELGEQTLGSSTSVTFNIASAANYITADDNLSTTFTIRATFLNDNTNVRDLDNIKIKLTNVTQGSGSELNTLVPSVTSGSWTKATGAVTNGQLTPSDKNIVDVVATKLQFTQQPPSVVGINRPVPLPPGNDVKIVANDANSLIDLEFNSANSSKLILSVPSAQLQTTSFGFTDGEVLIDKSSLVFLAPGDGTLTATSLNNPPTATSVTPAVSILVDVFDVTAVYSFGGVNTPSNIAGGSVNKIIYGVTFTAPFTRPSDPKLNSFVVSFDNTITGVFKNPRVFEQKNNSVYSSIIAKNITDVSIKGKVTQGSFSFTIDFTGVGGVPRDFNAVGGTTYTYFLMVDVETTANSGTPPMQPYVEDLDWKFGVPGSFDPTAGNIITSSGSTNASKTNTAGLTYSFAAIYPPSLISSNPSQGQLNVDPNSDIQLTFDAPIWSLDGTIELFQTNNVGTPGVKVGDLSLLGNPGRYDSLKLQTDPVNVNNLSSTITFDVTGPLDYNQIYYINIKKGTFDQTANTGTGIIDKSGNKFPGIFSPGVRYFRTASNIAPKLLSTGTTPVVPFQSQIINVSLTGATIQATFDAPGTAYFVLTNRPTATPPTNDQIKGDVAYAAALTHGNFTINQINPITQFGTINYAMSNNQQYDVWMFAENSDLPVPVRWVGPYQGAPTFIASATPSSPTFTFTATTPGGTGVILYAPTYSICPGSYQPLNEPIAIVERNAGDFSGTGSGIQTFNLLLPPGFQFDTSLPINGQVILSGTADFIANSGSLSFLSNSVVQVSYTNANSPNNSIDNISISGLRVLATGAAGGDITRLGGTALTAASAIPDGTTVATIGTNIIDPISFTNSYLGEGTILPDLINDKFRTVQLIPSVATDDYGSTTFSGQGVNLDSLYLSSVPLGLPFNITVTHTDNNGCVSQNAIQYLVYDHTTGLGLAPSYCITNNYFPNPGTYPTTYSVFFNSFPGFYLTSLSTDVPVTVTNGSQYLDNTWSSVVQSLPVKTGTGFNPNDNPLPGTFYYNYTFAVRTINNNTDWYYFSKFNSATGQGKPYYQGGSLGRVEYTGLYQSIANVALSDVKLIQSTQFFAPAVPFIEVSGNLSNGGVPVTNDPDNPVVASDFDPKNGPQPSGYLPNLGNPGTFIFCEQGGDITINGYPAASGGTSVGTFTLVDHASGTTLPLTPDPASPGNFLGFKDNGNGVATINPTIVNNGYNNIRIVYEYQDNNSPCKSIANLVIRITPNPVANFTTSMLCEDIDVTFTDTSTLPTAAGVSIATAIWNYSDTKASNTLNGDTILYPSTIIPIHRYSEPGSYPNVSLNVTTNFGCANVTPKITTLSVGGTPQVVFSFTGISTADPITFENTSTVANDVVAQLEWTFGDGNSKTVTSGFSDPAINTYSIAGSYKSNLKVTSTKGCNANLNKTVIILPKSIPTGASAYLATFEIDNGGWQHAATSKPGFNTNDSWSHGAVSKTVTQMDPLINGTKAWATSLTGTFNPEERSALYSPSFDLRNLSRPMVSFNSFVQFNSAEGVILQYSVDNKNVADSSKQWFVVGEQIGEGVDWFADQGIAAKPGDQVTKDFGWSGVDKVKWMGSKHALSDIPDYSRVVFRFALATLNKTPDREGFALDNFRIGERTRTVLIENFTNKGTSNTDEKTESDYLKNVFPGLVGTDYIKINYHVGFPGSDPFNATNPGDPSARALYYNVSKTPTAFLDSYDDPLPLNSINRLFSKWGETVYGSQSLELAGADITITATLLPSNTYSVIVSVTAKKDLPASTILHTGFLEAKIISTSPLIKTGETEFEYVLKKLLPSAAGSRFGTPLLKDETKTFGPFEWIADVSKLFPDANDLAVVAFLQDESTKEVHQSSLKSGLTDPSVVTGIEGILPEQVNVFPNPASKEFRVELPALVQNDVSLHMIDQVGRRHEGGIIRAGSNAATVNVENLSGGIYILEMGSPATGIVRKKIMVVMKN